MAIEVVSVGTEDVLPVRLAAFSELGVSPGDGGGLLWGNLRLDAVPFYERFGFVVQDDVYATHSGVLHRYGEIMISV